MAVESVAYEPGSPGRVFKLDEHSLIERLARIEDSSRGCFTWSDTAGVRNVARQTVADSGIFTALDTLDNKRVVRRHGKPRDDLPRNGSNKGRRKMLWVYELTACGEETMRWMVRAIDQLKPSGLSVRNDNGEG